MTERRNFSNLTGLDADELELFEYLLEEEGIEAHAQLTPITRRAKDDQPALSFAQQRLWFLNQLNPESAAYNMTGAVWFDGHLDVAALERSFNEIVRRHEVLRANFHDDGGAPVQSIAPSLTLSLPLVDLTALPVDERHDEARRYIEEEAQQGFDLAHDALVRARLLRLDDESHVLLITLHHIVCDGWSVGVLVRELSVLYAAYRAGEETPLAELAVQYADYARWQREWLAGDVLAAQLRYWRTQLEGELPVLNLPVDKPRQQSPGQRGAVQHQILGRELSERLKALSHSADATLFMTLLAAFQILLYRYTNQQDILVGTPVANRQRAEIEPLIGFFVNTLVMRTDLSGDPSFTELLRRVRGVALEAYAHQDLPFEMLVEAVQPARSLSHAPLFQVMFSLQNAPMTRLSLDGLLIRIEDASGSNAKFELSLDFQETGDGLEGAWQYDSELFEAATIERMAEHFRVLLEAAVRRPLTPVSQLPLLTAREAGRLLVEWNDTDASFPRDVCLHQLFEAQAAETPDAVALVFEDGELNAELTYAELDRRANQVASHLQKLGVSADARVGVLMERSTELVVGLLGTLKAGAAYVPLDPSYPAERLAYMLADARVRVLLTQRHLKEVVPAHAATVVCLDVDGELIGAEAVEHAPPCGVVADNLAYIIYTSGSTGQPKGAMLPHRGVVNSVWCMQRAHRLTADDATLLKTPLGFDASVWELFWPLSCGARVVIARPEGQKDTGYLVELIKKQRVTTVYFVPPLLSVFLEEDGLAAASSIRQVICGGESLPVETMRRFFRRLPSAQLHHSYGPTETSIGSTEWTCAPESTRPNVHIGRPVANTQIYLLDKHLQPVPAGVTGELYIGGEGLARGYLNRPDLTAASFIPHPFAKDAGARLYRTGDLASYLNDGNIEFRGRADNQVKVRGLRVELGEIEAALGAHEGVRESAVVTREDAAGDKRFIAYIVARAEDATLTASELREHLREKLPEFMLPSAFVFLEALPLMPSGKVDRHALPAPGETTDASTGGYVAPRTPVEEVLAGVWSEVLGVERVGVEDNFFDLGGHSLLATRVVARMRETFEINFSLSQFFETPLVSKLAARVESEMKRGTKSSQPPLRRASRERELPLSFAQQRLWFLDQLEPLNPVYNTSGALRLKGALSVYALAEAIGETLRRHEALRTTFGVVNGEPVQFIAPPQPFALPVVNLSELNDAERERELTEQIALEVQRPFDLSAGPLVRGKLLKLGDDTHVLVIVMHHIISDGWSVGVFVREVSASYKAISEGHPASLPELALQYADYAVWQREWLSGEALDAQLQYWRGQLAGAPPALELPTDRTRPKVQTFRGAAVPVELPESLTKELKTLSRRAGATLFMTLLAAFKVLLRRYTEQDDIVVGTPVANRQRAEIEPLIGFFVNTLVMRTDLSGDPSFTELLRRVRGVALEASAHQDLPFEMLVEAVQPARSLSHAPLFQVMFVFQNAPSEALELPELTLEEITVESTTAKFDLMLSLEETAAGLRGVLEYSADLFDETTVRRILEHFQVLLEGLVRQPDTSIAMLPLLTGTEKQRLLVEWNSTAGAFPKQLCVQQLFAAQAAQTPDTTAVIFGNERITYRELNSRANRLAHHLQKLGVGADSVVAVMAERSTEMVVGVLGILKAGGAYVPLDPEYPRERLAFMLQDTRARVLLTQERLLKHLPDGHDARVICLDADWEIIAHERESNPPTRTTYENLAYVIYTSGSTGRPKAVMMPHRALVNLVTFQKQSSTVPQPLRTLQFASLSFDVSVQEMFTTLCAGASLLLVSEDTRRDTSELLRVLADEQVERLFLPFVALQQIAETVCAGETPPSSLREIITAGEQLKITPHVERLFALLDGCTLDNHYGPTETHLATMWRLDGDSRKWPPLPPIGRPINNAEVYLLDEHQQPVPIGVAGELYIGGEGLARGYLRRPELTAEKFIPHPFSASPGARLYRTGDLARYLEDGRLEYAGRRDQQVKIRGFRVEMGEVEVVLKQHASVAQAAVAVSEDEEGRKRLVAYVVNAQDAPVPARELRGFLKKRLPEYMLPSVILFLDALPLTASGKVNHRALPAPESLDAQTIGDYSAPRTPVEEILTETWAEVLKLSRVGVDDNFFESGGHSLLATQLMSRVRQVFRIELPLRRLFERPTPAELAESIEAGLRAGATLAAPPLEPSERNGALPLSFAQQRLWFLDKLEPGSPFYNLPAALRIEGALDETALARCLDEIVRRHEVLRTNFDIVDGEPAQVIAQQRHLVLEKIDLSHMPPTEREAATRRHIEEEAQQGFDLAHDALVRARLLRLDDKSHVLLITLHHIVCDGWSVGVLVRELSVLYAAYRAGEETPLAELAVQYADYARWQREWLAGDVLAAQLRYWKNQLAGAPPVLELPADRSRPGVQTFVGAQQTFNIGSDLTCALKKLSRRAGATLFMTLLAAFKVLLRRYTGQGDIVVGTPIAGRNRAEIEPLIGFFVNTLVMRTDLGDNPTFQELLGRVRETTLGAYAHQDVPFEKLVEELQPARDLAHAPLFQVLFVLQNAPQQALSLEGLELSVLDVESTTTRFDLVLNMTETQEGLSGEVSYNTGLFDAATIERMIEHFQNLLQFVASQPQTPIAALPLSSPAEVRQLLFDWNNTDAAYPQQRCIHELFEAQAELTPDATAVRFEDEQLSYRELNARANQLASYLRKLGARAETRVGICVERSAEMLVGLLGILKAGAAYVPLSPAYPHERLSFIVADAEVELFLTQQRLLKNLPEVSARIISLDGEHESISREPVENLKSAASADNPAYVIYTSGSTGVPKGVEITHRSLVHSTTARLSYYRERVECFLLVSPFVFDSSVAGIFWTLCQGGTLAMLPEDSLQDPARLVATIARQRVSHVLCLPSLYSLMLERATNAQLKNLRSVIVAGEACPVELVRRHYELLPHAALFNEYGPTEATVWSAVYECDLHTIKTHIPIGRPIQNMQAYVLDEHQQPVPIGVAGELYIGGEGLARGYLRRPELTAEKFIPHPFGERSGARLYRTGDRVRFRRDGHMEFLGRADEQLKIRGYRIEPGEIEFALKACPAVSEAVVIAGDDVVEGKRLIGYVVPGKHTSPTTNELRDFLKERLPEHMIPGVFVFLEQMPRTASGKPDRRALPAPGAARPALAAPYVAPRNELEREIAAIWREALQLKRVGVHDNFFDLGGHSLLIIRVHGKLLDKIEKEFSVVELFRYPTVESLARHLGREQDKQSDEQNTRLRADARRESLRERAQSRTSRPVRKRP
jgi:amino acid adenylation domain-containing protein